jgi:hypothetical protein
MGKFIRLVAAMMVAAILIPIVLIVIFPSRPTSISNSSLAILLAPSARVPK